MFIDDPALVLSRAGVFLSSQPVLHNLVLSILHARVAHGPQACAGAAEDQRRKGTQDRFPNSLGVLRNDECNLRRCNAEFSLPPNFGKEPLARPVAREPRASNDGVIPNYNLAGRATAGRCPISVVAHSACRG